MMLEQYLDDIKNKLHVFDKFHFVEEPHIYWWLDKDGNRQEAETSMTALIHSYSAPFEEEEIAKRVALREQRPVEDVLADWKRTNLFSTTKGTYIHAFNENLWQQKEYNYPPEEVIKLFGKDVIEPIWGKLKQIALEFYQQYKDRLIPIGLELVIGDEELKICGSIDFLCYSKKLHSLIIIDYKSNKAIKFESYNHQKMRGCLSHLEDCNFIHYSLQLNGYQYILEKNTGLKLNNQHFIVWMNENNLSYEIYQTKDLYNEARTMLQEGAYHGDAR